MYFFTDTNIPVGYSVPHDKWHDSSVNFIKNTPEQIFWSNLVQKESKDKINSIVDDIEIYLIEIKKILKENEDDFDNYYKFEKFIKEKTKHCKLDNIKKTKILENFWIKNNFIEGISEELYIRFSDFNLDVKRIYLKRYSDLKDILILHDCGLDNYLKYYEYALELFKGGIHKPDCKIVVDAHDCGLTHDNLIFITNDGKMLKAIHNLDTSNLKIIEFRSCN